VFVNLWGGQVGRAMTCPNVVDIVARTQARGSHFTAHMLRHTYATMARRGGVPIEVISTLLTHTSVQTTSDIYVHATAEDLRAELERAGVMTAIKEAL
jgi:integrase/recombinase XerD